MTIALEHIQEGDWAAVNRVVDQLRSLVLDTGGLSLGIRVGTGTVTWPGGSKISSTNTVTHGLGRAPRFAIAGDAGGGTGGSVGVFASFSLTATTFGVVAETCDGTSPAAAATRTFYWVVVG